MGRLRMRAHDMENCMPCHACSGGDGGTGRGRKETMGGEASEGVYRHTGMPEPF